jgi:hypothetical protein
MAEILKCISERVITISEIEKGMWERVISVSEILISE